jgi:hypothetical protein
MFIFLIRAGQCKRCPRAVFGQFWLGTSFLLQATVVTRRLHSQAIRRSI